MNVRVASLDEAVRVVCNDLGIKPPRRLAPVGRYARTDTLERNGKGDAEVRIHADGLGVEGVNWQTQQRVNVRIGGAADAPPPALRRDPEQDRREAADDAAIAAACARIVAGCATEPHPYLARKGFPDELGLVCHDIWRHMPPGDLGERARYSIPEGEGPLLIVPGRRDGRITTVQMITAEGVKKNILKGRVGGASHRIATGRETWVCEGIATALSVRAALRFLGRSATVLSAFSAENVGRVATTIPGAIIAADHDKAIDNLGGLGTGEFYARRADCRWVMPAALGDFNDMHQSDGLRAVALRLREVAMG